jgi:hypothetical protein
MLGQALTRTQASLNPEALSHDLKRAPGHPN